MTALLATEKFLLPESEADVAAIVADAASHGAPLAITGGGTKAGIGRPVRAETTLSTSDLAGITLYEPAELVIAARAGTLLAEVENALASNGQRLAFEPADHRRQHGATGAPTIGGVVATNLSGPRRILAGAARDSLIGIRAVNGRGELVKSGGRVMKNVTGYDLVKLLAGSHGTLAVLTEVTFKVVPAPETEVTLALAGLDDATAIAALSAALGSPWSVSGAAHLPAFDRQVARTLVRLEGFAASVVERAKKLGDMLASFGKSEQLPAPASRGIWRVVRDLDALGAEPTQPIWRISVRPSDGPAIAQAVTRALAARILYDWGGGLVWIAVGETRDAGASVVRSAVGGVGGHATLYRAPASIREKVDVFEPLAAPVMDLTRRIKHAFDPAGILNPGRMYADV
jgi:glycolate oxidase FAD binding subunit